MAGRGGRVYEVYSMVHVGRRSYERCTELLIQAPANATRAEVLSRAEGLMEGPGEWSMAEWDGRLAEVLAGQIPVYYLS